MEILAFSLSNNILVILNNPQMCEQFPPDYIIHIGASVMCMYYEADDTFSDLAEQ